MKVWGVYDDEIRELADSVGLRIQNEYFHDPVWVEQLERWQEHGYTWTAGIRRDGAGYRFRLALRERLPTGELKFQKIGFHGRRTSGVCWHGFREFLFVLFREFPDARVKTALADFRGREQFLMTYRYTRNRVGWNFDTLGSCVCQPRPQRARHRSASWRQLLSQNSA
jgi:hypothetical protein